jgi:superfamily II DNA or RNA helicase
MINFEYDSKKKLGIISGDLFNEIREYFSVKNEAAHFMRKYGRFMPSRTYAITPTGRFDPCLFFEIKKYIISQQYVGEIVCSREFFEEIVPARHTWHQQLDYNDNLYTLNLILRDYQEDIVKECMKRGRGTVILATAGGKTLTSASLLAKIYSLYTSNFNKQNFKCLFIVPDRGLVSQTYQDFIDYGVPFSVSKWTGDDELNVNTEVIISNLGILQSKKSTLDWLCDVDILIVDEVHKIRKGNKINDILKKIKTPFRFGFTGTMPEEKLDQWNILGKIGPVIYEKNSFNLRQDNYVSNVQIQILNLIHKSYPHKEEGVNAYRQELEYLITSKFRNEIITKLAAKLQQNTLIMVDYIQHGEILFELIQKTLPDKQCFFIRGEVDVTERERVRQLMEDNNDVVVVAISKIFSTGVNIKNLHYIIFACGGKAKIKIVQSIGRGLRLHKDKTKLIIFDIADNLRYSAAHSQKRQALYEKEHITFAYKEIKEK